MAKNRTKNFKQYGYMSRYEGDPYYYDSYNNRYYYGLSSNLDKSTTYAAYTVARGDSYDSIAYNYYGNALFYWVICYFNDIENCLEAPLPGTVLKIPTLNAISFED